NFPKRAGQAHKLMLNQAGVQESHANSDSCPAARLRILCAFMPIAAPYPFDFSVSRVFSPAKKLMERAISLPLSRTLYKSIFEHMQLSRSYLQVYSTDTATFFRSPNSSHANSWECASQFRTS